MDASIEKLEKVIETTSAVISELEDRAFQDEKISELSMRQWLYLNTILRMGHPTFSDLAKELSVSKPSVTAIVGTLINKGYVEKVQDHEDLRTFHIVATPKAIELDERHRMVHKNLAAHLAKKLEPGEIEQLASLMTKVFQGLE